MRTNLALELGSQTMSLSCLMQALSVGTYRTNCPTRSLVQIELIHIELVCSPHKKGEPRREIVKSVTAGLAAEKRRHDAAQRYGNKRQPFSGITILAKSN